MNHEPAWDPEAVALSKVYALLIRAARQKKAKEQPSDGRNKTPQGTVNYEEPYKATTFQTE